MLSHPGEPFGPRSTQWPVGHTCHPDKDCADCGPSWPQSFPGGFTTQSTGWHMAPSVTHHGAGHPMNIGCSAVQPSWASETLSVAHCVPLSSAIQLLACRQLVMPIGRARQSW